MKIRTCVLGSLGTNCYIVCNDSDQAIIIDPADQVQEISKQLENHGLLPAAVLLTHGHFDHMMAAAELAGNYHIPIYACEAETELLGNPEMNCSHMMGLDCALIPSITIKDKEKLNIADMKIEVIHTPGHTAGGVCYYLPEEGALFCGDTLFFESMGRTDFPTGNPSLLLDSLHNKLMILPEEVIVYPGHGVRTTIGYEKANNPYLSEDSYWN